MSTVVSDVTGNAGAAPGGPHPVRGGSAAWACSPGFPPSTIFPFTPPERIGIRNLFEFQVLMFRPLYWLGRDGGPEVDFDLSLAKPPQWSADGLSVTVTLKPWRWSNGEPICADNVIFWINMMKVKGPRFGSYSAGYLPDNLTAYRKVADNQVVFTFDKAYSKTWVLMNQLSIITPMPRAWDRTATGPANASADLADIPAVYDYLVTENGQWTVEDNEVRTRWPDSPVWSVVNGPWRLKSFTLDGAATFVPNEHYCGPHKPYLDEFRQVPVPTDADEYALLAAGPHGRDGIQVGFLPYGLDIGATLAGTDDISRWYRLVPQDVYCIRFLPFNHHHPGAAGHVFRQPYFRQALQLCLDQDTAIRDIFHGYAHRTTGPVPPVPDSAFLSPAQRGHGDPFDPQRARALLAEHGWDVSTTPAVCVRPGDGPGCAGAGIAVGDRLSFSLRYVDGRAALEQLMRLLARDAATAGIELRLEPVYGSVMVAEDHCVETPDRPHRWELNCWNGGWAFYGQPTGETLFRTGAGSNFGHYGDARADELIDRTVVSDDPAAMYEYQDYLAEQVPAVWTPGFPIRLLQVARELHGIEPVNPYGMLTPENWYYTRDE